MNDSTQDKSQDKFENIEPLVNKQLKEMGQEHLLNVVLDKIKKCNKNNCKSTNAFGLSRIVIFRVMEDEKRRIKNLEIKKKLEEQKRLDAQAKKLAEENFIEDCKYYINKLSTLDNIRPITIDVLYSLLISKEKVSNLCKRLNVSRDVVYQIKKRGLDSIEQNFGFCVRN